MSNNLFKQELKDAIPIIKNELSKYKIKITDEELINFSEKVLSVYYGKGGLFDEKSIRQFIYSEISILLVPIVKDELKKEKIEMFIRDIGFMTYEIMKSLIDEGKGYSEKEIRYMTKKYISDGRYKNFIEYSDKLLNIRLPMSGTTKS